MKRRPPIDTIVTQAESSVLSPKPAPIVEMLPSGATLLDLALGGGYPVGRIINLVGDRSTGKTLLASEAIAHAHHKSGKKIRWFYDDAEAGYAFDSRYMYGIDIIGDKDGSSDTIEDFEANVKTQLNKLKSGEILIYVLDSFDPLASEAEVKRNGKDKEEQGGTYGLEKVKEFGRFFRLMRKRIKQENCLLIVLSQVRENIGVRFGRKHRRAGGKALDHYAAQIIWLSETEKHFSKGRATGVTLKAYVDKNKVGLPFRSVFINVLFDYGVDDVTSNLAFLHDLRTDTGKFKKDATFKWDRQEFSLPKAVRYIEHHNQQDLLADKVREKWMEIEDSIASKRRKKFE